MASGFSPHDELATDLQKSLSLSIVQLHRRHNLVLHSDLPNGCGGGSVYTASDDYRNWIAEVFAKNGYSSPIEN